MSSESNLIFSLVSFISATIFFACSRKRSPANVVDNTFVERFISTTPNSFSNAFIYALTDGCEICSSFAALEKLAISTTFINTSICLKSTPANRLSNLHFFCNFLNGLYNIFHIVHSIKIPK
jgi:hypothetical protein